MASKPPSSPPTDLEILTFLRQHPDRIASLLASHADLLEPYLAAAKTDPTPDGNIVSLIPALALKARAEAKHLSEQHKSLIHVATENMVNWTRLHHATLALLANVDLAEMGQVIRDEFPTIFEVNQCQLVIAREHAFETAAACHLRLFPSEVITAALGDDALYLGAAHEPAAALLSKPAASLAIVRLPDRLPDPVSHCALVLGSTNAESFRPDLGSDLLVLLAEMVGVALAARLESTGRCND